MTTLLLKRFRGLRVGVVGDLMADHHLQGRPTRLSREAPVIVIQYEREFYLPGGAANCAANLLSLGAKVALFGAVGRDAAGRALAGFFRRRGADVSGLLADPGYATITKTRILAGDAHRRKQQVIRIDREPPPLPAALSRRLEAAVGRSARRRIDAWLVADYGYGAVSKGVLALLRGRPAVVGTSRYAIGRLRGLAAVTANEAEALEATGLTDAAAAARTLFRRLKPRTLIVTRGNEGMLCLNGGSPKALPAKGPLEAVDVTGAGDTVIAVLTLALAAGAPPLEAAALANAAAGAVVMRPGAATLTPAELAEAAR